MRSHLTTSITQYSIFHIYCIPYWRANQYSKSSTQDTTCGDLKPLDARPELDGTFLLIEISTSMAETYFRPSGGTEPPILDVITSGSLQVRRIVRRVGKTISVSDNGGEYSSNLLHELSRTLYRLAASMNSEPRFR